MATKTGASVDMKRERAVRARESFLKIAEIEEQKGKKPDHSEMYVRDEVEFTTKAGKMSGKKGTIERFSDGWVHVKLDEPCAPGRRHVPARADELKVTRKAARPSNAQKNAEKTTAKGNDTSTPKGNTTENKPQTTGTDKAKVVQTT